MTTMDDLNYARDPRTQGPAEAPVVYMDDGSEEPLPMKWAVCPVCDGKGSHVNPSIDANGISREQFEDDPDFAEQYWNGTYDQTCTRCKGRTTVPVVDEDACDSLLLAMYRRQQQEEADDRRTQLAEMGMGA